MFLFINLNKRPIDANDRTHSSPFLKALAYLGYPCLPLFTLVYPGLRCFLLVKLFYLIFLIISNIDLNYFKTKFIKIACYGLIILKTALRFKLKISQNHRDCSKHIERAAADAKLMSNDLVHAKLWH